MSKRLHCKYSHYPDRGSTRSPFTLSPYHPVTLSPCHPRREGPTPVFQSGPDVAGHRLRGRARVAGEQPLDNGEVLTGLLSQAVSVVASAVVFPGDIAESAEQDLEPAQFLAEECVAARR